MIYVGRIILGYLLASVASGIGVGLVMTLATPGPIDWNDDDAGLLLGLMPMVVTMVLAVPALLIVVVAEVMRIRDLIYFAALSAFFGTGLGVLFQKRELVIAGFIFGLLAGWIYWRIAGRHTGAWR